MAIGKRLRFQIFRRDGFACRYCGLGAEDGAVLEVDHVHPRANGGHDEPSNLVTACSDCNSGKSDVPLGAPVLEDIPRATLQVALASRQAAVEEHEMTKEEWDSFVAEWFAGMRSVWRAGFDARPDPRAIGKFSVTSTQAFNLGLGDDCLLRAAKEAGKARNPDLWDFLEPDPELGPERLKALTDARDYLSGFIAAEEVPAIQRVIDERGGRFPDTLADLVIETASNLRMHVEEYGRDSDLLQRWLDGLPHAEGSKFIVRATAEWDAHWQGRRAHSALECRDEVLELAVRLALGAELPGA